MARRRPLVDRGAARPLGLRGRARGGPERVPLPRPGAWLLVHAESLRGFRDERHIAETSQALCRCLLPRYARILSGDAAMKERIAASPARCLLPRYARILSGDAAMKERIAASPARCLLPRYARILS